jgi:hypothetical protein
MLIYWITYPFCKDTNLNLRQSCAPTLYSLTNTNQSTRCIVSHRITLSTGGGSETVEGTVVGFLHMNASMEPFFCFEAALFCLALLSRHIFVLQCRFSSIATPPGPQLTRALQSGHIGKPLISTWILVVVNYLSFRIDDELGVIWCHNLTLTMKILLAQNLKASAKYCQSNIVHESALFAPCGTWKSTLGALWGQILGKFSEVEKKNPAGWPDLPTGLGCQIIIPTYPWSQYNVLF